jgi:IS5 family transposase
MMRPSLFAAQERETKLTKLGDTLQVLDRHVDFAALAAEVDADKRYKLIRKLKVSTASENDTNHFEDVLVPANTSCAVLADKGYIGSAGEARLAGAGWRMFIRRKGSKDKPLSDTQERRNRRIAKTRARVEHVFAGLAQMGHKTQRSVGLARATLHLNWKVAAYNLRRLC